MAEKKRFLVTTALEETWPSADTPVLFLGKWARVYSRKEAWENRDSLTVPYHWGDREKLYRDYLCLQALYEQVLNELTVTLNMVHGVNHTVRYWRILVGPWLNYFIQILFDRWACLLEATRHHDIAGVKVIQRTAESLIPDGMSDFPTLFVSDYWNEAIYRKLLLWSGIPNETVCPERDNLLLKSIIPRPSLAQEAKRAVGFFAQSLNRTFCHDKDHFFINSYLPIKNLILLQLKLGQIPTLWRSKILSPSPINWSMRHWKTSEPNSLDDFPAILRKMIPTQIPTAYLEGYRELVAVGNSNGWPKCPKTIFTSNSHISDDLFKGWSAGMVEKGVPLIIGQHGGSYGVMKWFANEEHEKAISDSYLTWGWQDPTPAKTHPVGMYKLRSQGFEKNNSNTAVLLIQQSLSRYSGKLAAEPLSSTFESYLNEQFEFIDYLPRKIVTNVIVRLYAGDYGWKQADRWRDRHPDVCVDRGNTNIHALMRRSRIVVGTYNGTTFLESMALNMPTIVFWNPSQWELRGSALPFFEVIRSVGIFHETPQSAAVQINKVWGDVSGWWYSEAVQLARKAFCERYARVQHRPINVMATLFRQIADSRKDTALNSVAGGDPQQ